MANEKYIRDRFDIEQLYRIGFLDTKSDFEKIEKRIVEFFELKNIYQWDHIMDVSGPLKVENIFSEN